MSSERNALFFQGVASDPPPFSEVLTRAVVAKASDIILRRNLPIMFKVGGTWYRFSDEPLEQVDGYVEHIGRVLFGGEGDLLARLQQEGDIDLSFALPTGERFRTNLSMTSEGPLIICRVIRSEAVPLQNLGFSEASVRAILGALQRKRGLVLVVGTTGSGKSTTLAAMIDWLNKNTSSNIVTIEDPIEYVFISGRSVIHQREVETHTRSFARALKSALRQAPDVIMVGEMRDVETIKSVITAAETGHLVFSTLHTKSAPETVTRIIDAMPPEDRSLVRQQLAYSLNLVIAQKLVPSLAGGVSLAYELFVMTDAIRSSIMKGENTLVSSIKDAMFSGANQGMQTLEQSLLALVQGGVVAPEVALAYANEPREIEGRLNVEFAHQRPAPPQGGTEPPSGASGGPSSQGVLKWTNLFGGAKGGEEG